MVYISAPSCLVSQLLRHPNPSVKICSTQGFTHVTIIIIWIAYAISKDALHITTDICPTRKEIEWAKCQKGVCTCVCVRIYRLSSHKSYARVTQNVVQKGYALHHVNRLSCQHLPVAPYLLPGLELSMLSGSPIWRENTTFKFWHNNNTTTLQWVRYELWI